MDEQELDDILGRMMRERTAAKRKLAIMGAEIATLERELRGVADALRNANADGNLSAATRALETGTLAKYGFAKLVSFINEYNDAKAAVAFIERQVQDLDIE